MNKIGVIKTKILKKLTESFQSGEKSEMKQILSKVLENKDFKEMYLFYEEIENKFFESSDTAKLYVEELNSLLKSQSKKISKLCEELNKELISITVDENEIYSCLDQLSEEDNFANLDKKIIAKKKLVEHLTKNKSSVSDNNAQFTSNENLLYSVLANNFNSLYSEKLDENQKEELKNILAISNDELEKMVPELKEDILSKVGGMLNESTDNELNAKLKSVVSEVSLMGTSKYNYFRLKQLKDGLN